MTGRRGRLFSLVGIGLALAVWSARPAAVVPITTTTTQLTTHAGQQFDPDVSGNIVIWTDQRNGNDDVFACDRRSEDRREQQHEENDAEHAVGAG